jgi:hypothetical protein
MLTPALNENPDFVPHGEGKYLVSIELDNYALEDMDKYRRIDTWTTDHWDTINYYLLNSQNIGLGHLLFRIPKDRYGELFGDEDAEAKLESLEGCTAIISMARVAR